MAKVALFDTFASVAAALGSGRRAEIVDVLAQGERSVEELANEVGQSLASTSYHLRLLAKAGLARSRREGHRVVYRLASERVGELWAAV
ncbi:MAG: metalloregulator ArsR/SmtB family transcription factor, partial [Actinobacteria bacterium]|nr:metalloregulator ArsR/SmtB family transcription factor [Actinomycetota bacterium]